MYKRECQPLKKITGMMLLEMLLAVMLGLLVLSMLFEIFLATERSYHLQLALHRLEEHAKTAVDLLQTEIHRAGHIGCARLTQDFPVYTDYADDMITPTNKLTMNPLTVRYVDLPSVTTDRDMRGSHSLLTSTEEKFKAGDILMIADCQQAEIFRVKKIYYSANFQEIIAQNPLHKKFKRYAEVGRLITHTFYIDKTKRKYTDGTWEYGLFVQDEKKHKFEIVPGIHAMHIAARAKGVAIDLEIEEPPLKKIWHAYVRVGG